MPMTKIIEGREVCDQLESECRCREDTGHEGAHVCPCGGSWLTDEDGNFADVVEWPSMYPIPGLERTADW